MKISIALMLIAAMSVTGCSLVTGEIAPRVAKAVNTYCAEPLASRQLIRAEVTRMTAPNSVRVTCEGDPQ